ncbi:MAG TPA: serine hydrolase domain-containing protein [Steroidobacteraceae bacterium]|nr:serine hydrolase domain-containing protein [Steroidobacteraceae bacterium]
MSAVALMASHFGPASAAALPSTAVAQIGSAANGLISEGHAPAVSVAVMQKGRVAFAEAYGLENLETRTAASTASVFRAGSITKEFTAAAIMQLAQAGKLAIDDQVSKYVPELAGAGPLTIRMLLNQTSGLHDYTNAAGFDVEELEQHTSKQLIDFIAAMKPVNDFKPGTQWAYSNTNYFVLGVIVERASGISVAGYLAKYVIAPAGLTATGFDHVRDVVPGRASGYMSAKEKRGQYYNAPYIAMDNAGGAGQLRATALDLALWQQALFAGRIVSEASVAAMTTPGRLSDGTVAVRQDAPITPGQPNYGFGLELGKFDGVEAIGHGGAVPGFTAYLVTFPKRQLTVAIMTNGQVGPVEPFREAFREIVRAALHGLRP